MIDPHALVRPRPSCPMCGDMEGFITSTPFYVVRCAGTDGCQMFNAGEHLEWLCDTCGYTVGTSTFAEVTAESTP